MNALELDNVFFSYTQCGPNVIAGISGVFSPGENVLLVGDNGSGKSTLGKLLCGLLAPTHGNLTLQGEKPNQLLPHERISLACYVGQDPFTQFVKNSLQNEILFSVKTSRCLDDYLDYYDNFLLPDDRSMSPYDLSVNHAWRFMLYLAFIVSPVVLFIDEVPSMSNIGNKNVMNFILEHRKQLGKITFLSYQRSIPVLADKSLSIESGVLRSV